MRGQMQAGLQDETGTAALIRVGDRDRDVSGIRLAVEADIAGNADAGVLGFFEIGCGPGDMLLLVDVDETAEILRNRLLAAGMLVLLALGFAGGSIAAEAEASTRWATLEAIQIYGKTRAPNVARNERPAPKAT